ncbi:MAG: phage tail tape measure protein [Clostridiales bacterium]|nr:phage tail tape measure protein [Clostridiales bacterium]
MAGRIKGIVVEIGGDVVGLNKALSGVNKEIGNTQKELKDVERLLKFDPTNTELLRQKQQLLAKAIDETKTKLDVLKNAEQQAQEQFKQGKISEQQYDALKREIIATEQSLKNLQEQAAKSNGALSKVSDVTGKVSETAGKVGDKMIKVTAGFTGLGVVGVKSASDINKALNDLQTATGLTADEMDSYRDIMENIYKKNYGESFEDVSDAIAEVVTQVGKMDGGEGLQRLTEDALVLRDAFGYDVSESVRAANTLMNQFGISGEEAFNLLAQGAQNGLDYSDELLDSINEYSVQFSKMGLSADDMFNIFVAGAKNGAFNLDKIGDAVKENAIRVIDLSDTSKSAFEAIGLDADVMAERFAAGGEVAKEAFLQVTNGIAAMKDPLEQNTVGVSLFGTMWEDLGPQVVTQLGNIQGGIDGTKNSMEELKNVQYDDVTERLAAVGRNLQTEVLIPLGEMLIPVLEMVVGKLSDLISWWSNLDSTTQTVIATIGIAVAAIGPLAKGIESVSTVMGFLSKSAIPALGKALDFLKANPIVAIVAAILGFIKVIQELWDKNEAFRQAVLKIWEFITGIFQKFDDFLTGIFQKDWTENFGVFGNILNAFFDKVESVWNLIKGVFSGMIEFLKGVFTGNWQGALNGIKSIFESVFNFFGDKLDWLKTLLSGIIDFVVGVFTGDWEKAWEGIKNIFKGIFDALVGIVKTPLNFVIGLINKAIDGINVLIRGVNAVSSLVGLTIPEIPHIPKLAKGGTVLEGNAIVGEAGPELLSVINGKTRVTPLTHTQKSEGQKLVGGGYQQTVNIYSPQALSPAETARQTRLATRRLLSKVGVR